MEILVKSQKGTEKLATNSDEYTWDCEERFDGFVPKKSVETINNILRFV
jgi:hypothetical protein